jgi:hypothetical protein
LGAVFGFLFEYGVWDGVIVLADRAGPVEMAGPRLVNGPTGKMFESMVADAQRAEIVV